MNKKEYIKPSVETVDLGSTASILAGSDIAPQSIFDEEVEEYNREGEKPSGWGAQW